MEAYPLHWPLSHKRTLQRFNSQFKKSMEAAQQMLHKELQRIGATDIIVSSNIPVRKDGMFYTDWMSRKIDDPGVAVYFSRRNKQSVICCDQYRTIWENVYAIAKTLENLRAIDRWGVSDFLDKAFTGFTAIPESIVLFHKPWYEVLQVKQTATENEIVQAYRQQAKIHHPDVGGSSAEFNKITAAYKEGLNYIKERKN